MRRPALLAAAAAMTFLLTSCSTPDGGPGSHEGPTPPPAASTPAPPPSQSPSPAGSVSADPELDSEPDRVADDVARRFWASDTRTDSSPADAAARTAGRLTPDYAKIATTVLPTGAAWQELADHEGHYVVEVADVDDATGTASTTSTRATRTRLITLTPTGAKGWTGHPRYLVATFSLTGREGGRWLVDRIDVEESLTGGSEDAHSH
jgi:hypothetical protein